MKSLSTLSLLLIFCVLPVEAQTLPSETAMPTPTNTIPPAPTTISPPYLYNENPGFNWPTHNFNCLKTTVEYKSECNSAYESTKSQWHDHCLSLQGRPVFDCLMELAQYKNNCEQEANSIHQLCIDRKASVEYLQQYIDNIKQLF